MQRSGWHLPTQLWERYGQLKQKISQRLEDFRRVPKEEYIRELCFCLLTPQTKASSAIASIDELTGKGFFEQPFDPSSILADRTHYIRFHNNKASYLIKAINRSQEIITIVLSNLNPMEKRIILVGTVDGMGMKEGSHFLRNIGYRRLAILDRHILKHLVLCGVYDELPKIGSAKKYLEIEAMFSDFCDMVGIPIDEIDLLFWSYETGVILK